MVWFFGHGNGNGLCAGALRRSALTRAVADILDESTTSVWPRALEVAND
jgi:hypothetical protein